MASLPPASYLTSTCNLGSPLTNLELHTPIHIRNTLAHPLSPFTSFTPTTTNTRTLVTLSYYLDEWIEEFMIVNAFLYLARHYCRYTSIHRKCQNLAQSNSPRDFWHLAKNISNNFSSSSFPPMLHSDGTTTISSISKAELIAQTFANSSTLADTGLVPPTPPPSD